MKENCGQWLISQENAIIFAPIPKLLQNNLPHYYEKHYCHSDCQRFHHHQRKQELCQIKRGACNEVGDVCSVNFGERPND